MPSDPTGGWTMMFDGGWMTGPWGGGFGVFGIFMMIFWIAILVLLVFGVVALARWLGGQARPAAPGGGDTALEILKRRYARGEINKEEFESKRKDLES